MFIVRFYNSHVAQDIKNLWNFLQAEAYAVHVTSVCPQELPNLQIWQGSVTSCVQKALAVCWCVIKSSHYQGVFPFHLLFLNDHSNPRRPLFCVQGVFYSELFKVKLSLNLSDSHCLPPKPKWAEAQWLSKWQRVWPLTECWTWLPNIPLIMRTMTWGEISD